jgi:hypothetical protein
MQLSTRLFQVENSFSIKADEVYLIYDVVCSVVGLVLRSE